MLPRELRVSRCKAPHKTARAMEARASKSAPSDRKGARDSNSKRPGKKGGEDAGRYVPKPTAESQTLAGRASKLLGRFGGAQLVGKPRGGGGSSGGKDNKKRQERKERFRKLAGGGEGGGEKSGFKAPEQFVFEGRRASAKDGKPKDLKFKTKSKTKDPRHKKRKGAFGK